MEYHLQENQGFCKWETKAIYSDKHFAEECCFYLNPLLKARFRVRTVHAYEARLLNVLYKSGWVLTGIIIRGFINL